MQFKGTDPFSASLSLIMIDSTHLSTRINLLYPALHLKIEGYDVGKHPIICRLLEGMFKNRPLRLKYAIIWSIDQILELLEFWPEQDLNKDVKKLTLRQLC